MSIADGLVTPGGPSGPAWAFFTALLAGVLTLIGQQLKAHNDLKKLRAEQELTRHEASKAAESAVKAQENTTNVSNGFANRVDRKLDQIYESQQATQNALRDHLEWHLERGE